jgi:hypothetical protein
LHRSKQKTGCTFDGWATTLQGCRLVRQLGDGKNELDKSSLGALSLIAGICSIHVRREMKEKRKDVRF